MTPTFNPLDNPSCRSTYEQIRRDHGYSAAQRYLAVASTIPTPEHPEKTERSRFKRLKKRLSTQRKTMSEPQPNAIDQHLAKHQPTEKLTPQRKAEISREKMNAALTDLIAEGKVFNLEAVCERAGLSHGLIYTTKFADIKQRAQQAIAELKSATKPAKVAEMKLDRTVELERQVAELEQRNRELRQQLAQARVEPGVDGYLKGLKADELHWRELLQSIDTELSQLQADREAAIKNLYAVQRLIATKTGEEPALEMQIVVSANGNGSSNGHRVYQA